MSRRRNNRNRSDWSLDPEKHEQEKRIHNAEDRFWYGPPPEQSAMSGPQPPFCPMVMGTLAMPVSEQKIVVAGREANQVQIKIDAVPIPCQRERCLFWDHWDGRCGITSMLAYMAESEELEAEENANEGPSNEAEAGSGQVPAAEGGTVHDPGAGPAGGGGDPGK